MKREEIVPGTIVETELIDRTLLIVGVAHGRVQFQRLYGNRGFGRQSVQCFVKHCTLATPQKPGTETGTVIPSGTAKTPRNHY